MSIPNVALGDIIEARLFCLADEQVGVNVVHYRATAPTGGPVTLTEVTAAVEGLWAPVLKPGMSTADRWWGAGCRRVFPLPPSLEVFDATNRGAGTAATANSLPRQAAGLITKRTDSPGAAGRGRFYMAFPNGGASTGQGIMAAGYATVADVVRATLIFNLVVVGGIGTIALVPIVYNRTAHTFNDITSATTRYEFATMKKRGVYGRPNPPPF